MNLGIRKEQTVSQSILFLSGEVDVYTAPELKENLYPLLDKQSDHQVLLDLTEVVYMDSTGLGVIIGALKIAKASHCQLMIRNVNDRIQRLFDITGLAEIVEINNERAGKKQ